VKKNISSAVISRAAWKSLHPGLSAKHWQLAWVIYTQSDGAPLFVLKMGADSE
jgi:hypothetical protein